MTQEKAWLTNQVVFAVSNGRSLVLFQASEFRPYPGLTVEFVAWPPHWHYRPTPGRLAWLRARIAK